MAFLLFYLHFLQILQNTLLHKLLISKIHSQFFFEKLAMIIPSKEQETLMTTSEYNQFRGNFKPRKLVCELQKINNEIIKIFLASC